MRKQRKKKVLKGFISRSIADGLQMVSQGRIGDQTDQNGRIQDGPQRRQRRCGRCREPGHTVTTCPQPVLATLENVDSSLPSN